MSVLDLFAMEMARVANVDVRGLLFEMSFDVLYECS